MGMRPLPKSLQAFIAKYHPEQFDEGWSEQDGFNERDPYNGWAHWVYLKKGWHNGDWGSHIIHEDNVKACKEAFRWVKPCDCDDCKSEDDAKQLLIGKVIRDVSLGLKK